ncbi:hypothetical protein NPIL_224031 [Nephila pilipes]|uniref:Uncharacterized protein n=1 Tax=Nephila pilipes TaxID=299642 RepID=A0A8X6PRZ4_NEPPI|nr:hypothetical protein NPIL_224031 [Nephila pilipes]
MIVFGYRKGCVIPITSRQNGPLKTHLERFSSNVGPSGPRGDRVFAERQIDDFSPCPVGFASSRFRLSVWPHR